MKRIYALLAAGSCLVAAVPAVSATIIKTVTINLNSASISADHSSLLVSGSTFAPIAIGDNDTLDYTILFSGTQAITVTDADSFYARLRAVSGAPATNVQGSGKLTLIGSTNYTSDAAVYAYSNSDSAGQVLDAVAQFNPDLPLEVTFTGVRYVGTVDYTSAGVTTRNYNLPSFQVSGETVRVTGQAAGAVPEPASWALMVIGFGAVGSALRRRSVAASARPSFR